jgi:N-acetyl-gamma-glutamyl-phosphate reductase
MSARIGLLGARGHVGAELLRLVWRHPELDIAFLGSRQLAGQRLAAVLEEASASELCFEDLTPQEAVARRADLVFLALPNGLSEPYVAAFREHDEEARLIDLSADHRFDAEWSYGLAEHHRARLRHAKRIANPGCYATAAQLALRPLRDELAAPPAIFGVSGYSGAGTTPSPRNDIEALRDNLIPYALVGHVHEREIAHHLDHPVRFMPHVAAFFRGITLTIDCELARSTTATELIERFREHYRDEPLVSVTQDPPLVRDAVGRHGVSLGGFTCGGARAVLVATIDNLLKGAATQAMQNGNLALGLPELLGIVDER